MSVSGDHSAERGRRSSRASSPKYCSGPRVATLRPLRRTEAVPSTMMKNRADRPLLAEEPARRTWTSSSARRILCRSRPEQLENSQMFGRSVVLALGMGERLTATFSLR